MIPCQWHKAYRDDCESCNPPINHSFEEILERDLWIPHDPPKPYKDIPFGGFSDDDE